MTGPRRPGTTWSVAALAVVGLAAGLSACTSPESPAPQATWVTVPPPRSLPPDPSAGSPSGGEPTQQSASPGPQGERDGKPRNTPGVERTAEASDAARLPRARVTCPTAVTTEVSGTDQLQEALDGASPGDVIRLAPATYTGAFVTTRSGTADEPIWLCGSPDAVLEGEGIKSGYVLHLDGATHWRLVGFSVRNGQKGVMADGTVGTVIQGLTVDTIGDEGIHLRGTAPTTSSSATRVGNTGQRRDKFGEGVYIGTAISNWCTITACEPDRSDRNVVAENVLADTTSENIDIKEGTVGGLLVANRLDGSGTRAADSLVDVKGTAWLVVGNTGRNAPLDGFQTHQIEDRWGERNVFSANTVAAGPVPDGVEQDGDGRFGFAFRPTAATP